MAVSNGKNCILPSTFFCRSVKGASVSHFSALFRVGGLSQDKNVGCKIQNSFNPAIYSWRLSRFRTPQSQRLRPRPGLAEGWGRHRARAAKALFVASRAFVRRLALISILFLEHQGPGCALATLATERGGGGLHFYDQQCGNQPKSRGHSLHDLQAETADLSPILLLDTRRRKGLRTPEVRPKYSPRFQTNPRHPQHNFRASN